MKTITVVVPVWNETDSVQELTQRISDALKKNKISYEIVFVDDHSTDGTTTKLGELAKIYPITIVQKKGPRGKAQSLLEGFAKAKYDVIAMIDADLQYPPEALPEMMLKLEEADIVVANRKEQHVPMMRKILSSGFHFLFTKLLHGLPVDAQSGMKVFRKEILDRIELSPTPWSFDLEFLLKGRDAGYRIADLDIVFASRKNGETKIHLLSASTEIGLSSIRLLNRTHAAIPFSKERELHDGHGFHYRGSTYIHHTTLPHNQTAFHRLMPNQIMIALSIVLLVGIGVTISWYWTVITIIFMITVLYFSMLFFDFYMLQKGYFQQPEIDISEEQIINAKGREWPRYTILCPLYKEWQVLPQFITAMNRLDYPKNKLQVLLLLEEDDKETIRQIKEYEQSLPKFFEIIIVPHSYPKTKPKACNYGAKFTKGEYVVIYDAEDVPDPLQLKKAVLAFDQEDEKVICLQAKLNFYNPHQNLLTRLFTAEYSLWFDLVLTGMQSADVPIPLGGTSNHFKVAALRDLQLWDAFNVTEDADLGIRLIKKGYRTEMLDSVTLEEANSHFFNWIRQRSRWIKGYMQTYFVHTRDLRDFHTSRKRHHKYSFQLVMGAKILSTLINPIMWATTILYFAWRTGAAPLIERFFPAPILYMGVLCFVFGNFLYMYYYMIGSVKRGHYDLVKYTYLVPFYWLTMSYAGWVAVVSLIRDPHYWEKTVHGFHIENKKALEQSKQTIGRTLVDKDLVSTS